MGLRKRINSPTARASGSRVNNRVRLTYLKPPTEAGFPRSTNTADLAHGFQERLIQENLESADCPNEADEWLTETEIDTTYLQNDPERTVPDFRYAQTIGMESTSDPTISPTALQDHSIIFAEAMEEIKKLSREDLHNIKAMLMGTTLLVWHLLRVFLVAYLPVLRWSPRLITTALAFVTFPIFWCMARAHPIPQKIRLMSFVASAGNWLIFTLESWVVLYYGWLCLTDGLTPWKMGDAVSEGQWILTLFAAGVFVLVNILISLVTGWLVIGAQLDGCTSDFKDWLFSEPEE